MKRISSKTRKTALLSVAGVAGFLVLLYLVAAAAYLPRCGKVRASCLEHRKAGCSIDGVYNVSVGGRVVDAQCDMKTDGGGWTLVGNYLHQAKAEATQKPVSIPDHFPVFSGRSLGESDYGTDAWGHAAPVLLEKLQPREIRFNCRSSSHTRVMDFSVSESACLKYLVSGKGRCIGGNAAAADFQKTIRNLPGHNTYLPAHATNGFFDQGDLTLTHFPFFRDWSYHWTLGTKDDRWECDDFDQRKQNHTSHRIWAR